MFYSPLRYPGGKGKLAPFIEYLIQLYGHDQGVYIEPFAGGAAIAMELLQKGVVSEIVINDLDVGVYSFWRALLEENERFINCIENVPLTITEWKRQREICFNSSGYSFDLGFSVFYLNRTNRSGIIKAGVIGGTNQSGKWKMDARFNKKNLISRVAAIGRYGSRIHLYNEEIGNFITSCIPKYENNAFIYFDPPYYEKGKELYLNFFEKEDHERIEYLIRQKVGCDWVLTYDNAPEIDRIYQNYNKKRITLNYSVAKKRKANELIIFKPSLSIPNDIEFIKRGMKFD